MGFSVCALVREPASIIHLFVEHYEAAGAERVFLYFDGSASEAKEAINAFADNKCVSVTCCDTAYWEDVASPQPMDLDRKLISVFRDSIVHNRSDWILFCDVDEFFVGASSLGDLLGLLPLEIEGVRVRNTEAVWRSGDDIAPPFSCKHERFPLPRGFFGRVIVPILVYGRDWRFLRRGTTGHGEGKHALRKGVRPAEMTSHASVINGQPLSFLHELLPEYHAHRIVHYDAVGFERWLEKWRVRISGETISLKMSRDRRKQMSQIEQAIHSGQAEKLFRRFNSLNRWQYFFLSRLGLAASLKK